AAGKLSDCIVEIQNPLLLSSAEKNQIFALCKNANFALFQIQPMGEIAEYERAVVSINTQLGLLDFDKHLYAKSQGLAHITQAGSGNQAKFIPYTNKNLGWHTDGYYNSAQNRIRAFSLFCVNPAKTGGENQWIDAQMVYLLLHEKNPDITKALTHPEALKIPEHKVNSEVRREASTGAIFFIDEKTNQLSMRYTQRKKNIELLNSAEIIQAVAHLDELLNSKTDYHFSHLMPAGQGILCNNILHKRSSFTDDKSRPRLLLRGRYFNRINAKK
ncbi:MAG: TauD/TfdA family dioxygenase, partial [Candidatus Thioglobus sp.]|nr:TauD/TfdA family dioxygenase [Candidatus Thioglobus sp.]